MITAAEVLLTAVALCAMAVYLHYERRVTAWLTVVAVTLMMAWVVG